MQRLFCRIAALSIVLHGVSAICSAQLVVVRPGYVKAPFVRVYSYPDGSSYVRAPFVGIRSPGRWPRAVYLRRGPAPTPTDMAKLDWRPLRRVLRQSAAEFDTQLSRFPTGEVWRSHFDTRRILELVQPDDVAPPNAEEQAQLAEILQNFDGATRSSDMRAISSLSSFRVLHAAIREHVTPVELRLRRQLVTSTDQFSDALGNISTGEGWKKYLALRSVVQRDETTNNMQVVPSNADLAELEKLLARFDSVSQEEAYRMIARLPAFRATHNRLRAYVNFFGEPPFRANANTEAVEELPTPNAESQ